MKNSPPPGVVELIDALHRRYPRHSNALLTQVRNATGYARLTTRYADALVMGLWPSRGLLLEGFEFKVSRPDWLHELRNPHKADEFFGYCDKWWLVTTQRDIATLDELPPRWGLLVLHGPNLRVLREAQVLQPSILDRPLLASLLRSALDNLLPEGALQIEREQGRTQGIAEEVARHAQERASFERLQNEVKDFERLSGLTFATWDPGVGARIGNAVNAIKEAEGFVKRMQEIARNATWLATQAEHAAQSVEAANAILPSPLTPIRVAPKKKT